MNIAIIEYLNTHNQTRLVKYYEFQSFKNKIIKNINN